MRVGAIDCGTNSIRLLIADLDRPSSGEAPVLREILREMRIVRLGAGVDATGWLSQEALDRTFAAVEEYAALLEQHEVQQVRMVATSATRDAGNRRVFAEGIRQRLGVDPEVISGSEEAELSFRGAMAAVPPEPEGRSLVIDLGGGSTEFVLGSASGVLSASSVNIGCVRLTERYISSNPPTARQLESVVHDVDQALASVAARVPLDTATRLIGVAGTVTTVTAQALGLDSYDVTRIDGAQLSVAEVVAAAQQLTAMTREQRASLGFMHEGRADVIGAGACIWGRIVERVQAMTGGRVDAVLTSEHDILDGLALSQLAEGAGSR